MTMTFKILGLFVMMLCSSHLGGNILKCTRYHLYVKNQFYYLIQIT